MIWKSYQQNIDNNYIPDARLLFILEIIDLQNAGFPIEKDDLTLEQWKWLSEIKSALQLIQLEQMKK